MICLTLKGDIKMSRSTSDMSVKTVYFSKPGPENTNETLKLAKTRADELGIKSIIISTTSGKTGVKAAELFQGYNLIMVTHSTGFKGPDTQELTLENQKKLEKLGAKLVTTTHAFGGIGRAVRMKLNTYQLEEIIAYTLRMFGQGVKVAIEMIPMAADAGLIKTTEEVISIGGTGTGVDTALVIKPTHAQTFFDLKILEVICKPRYP